MKIGVLALQGAVAEHVRSLEAAGAEAVAIKWPQQLEDVQGLVIPGGESTTIGKLMRKYDFIEAIQQFSEQGKPIFGTCAGLIVLATQIEGNQGPEQPHLALMDMKVRRNAFGRQRESFEADLSVKGINEPIRAVFIRAPLIDKVGSNVDVICETNGEMVTARQGHLLACSFHPELTDDIRLHQYFADMVRESMQQRG
ncbi:pyridoxal 5'-phosphate synthase glutaminase subunit PdxT [Paenibacillus sp. ACRRX]|uniref:pyridoxal 5'-phosphate synthase glutaminase subunit PdxT n=1 Tax=Paenibacillus sp. ACRRX TaxID=2918206 RepID=UPI001EF50AA7|nr:pyridoxal 5'-phosphate synthase glutaminase subunit PdxT [Paenibacillus sp. ACRRX]